MRPVHLSLAGFMLISTFSPFWFDFASTEYPQRLAPHCSIRTLPSFSSVSHMPSGELADAAAVVAGAGACAAGAVATTGAASGLAVGVVSCGARVLAAGWVDVMISDEGATRAVVVAGSGEAFAAAGAGSVAAGAGAGFVSGACGSTLACSGVCLRERSVS